ncbi:MAG: hypothetical protein WCA99_16475 [Candidatus Sulfotelmatobacter sp.]
MKLLHLLPIGNVEDGLLKDLCRPIEEALRVPCRVLPVRLDPEFAFHGERQQYHSSEILQRMQSFLTADSWRMLGIGAVDMYIPILTFVFGEAQVGVRARWSRRIVCGRNSMDYPPTGSCFANV